MPNIKKLATELCEEWIAILDKKFDPEAGWSPDAKRFSLDGALFEAEYRRGWTDPDGDADTLRAPSRMIKGMFRDQHANTFAAVGPNVFGDGTIIAANKMEGLDSDGAIALVKSACASILR